MEREVDTDPVIICELCRLAGTAGGIVGFIGPLFS